MDFKMTTFEECANEITNREYYSSNMAKWRTEPQIKEAAELYAKKHAIEFSKFKETYKIYESQKVKMQQDKLDGIFTWFSATDEVIYEAFLKGEQLANPLDERFLKEGK